MNRVSQFNEVVTILKPVAVEDDIEKKIIELKKLDQQIKFLNTISGKLAGRLGELSKDLIGVVKGAVQSQVNIDDTIIQYSKRAVTSVSYATVLNKALEMLTDEQKALVDQYKDSITNKGTSESLKVIDPTFEAFLSNLKYMDIDKITSMAGELKDIPDKLPLLEIPVETKESIFTFSDYLEYSVKEAFISSMKQILGKWANTIKTVFSKLSKKIFDINRKTLGVKKLAAISDKELLDFGIKPDQVVSDLQMKKILQQYMR